MTVSKDIVAIFVCKNGAIRPQLPNNRRKLAGAQTVLGFGQLRPARSLFVRSDGLV